MEERVLVLIAQSLQPAGPRHRRRCRRRFAPAAGLCARGPAAASWSLEAIALFDLTLFVSFRFQFCGPTSRQDYVISIFEVFASNGFAVWPPVPRHGRMSRGH